MDTIVRRNPDKAVELQPKYRICTEELVTVFSRIIEIFWIFFINFLGE